MNIVNVQLPSQLSDFAAGHRDIEIEASTLGEVFRKLDEVAPMIHSQIFDTAGSLRQFVCIFIDEKQVCDLGDGSHPVRNGCQLLIIMSVAGG